MSQPFTRPALPVLAFTDLDGTLLDHDDYGFDEALPALRRLRDNRIPLVPTTSKTLAEIVELNDEQLHNPHPCIVENGALLCIPEGYFSQLSGSESRNGYQLLRLARPYSHVIAVLHDLRRSHGYRFSGFNDMSCEKVAQLTGLSHAAAACARQRLAGEPLVWEDSEAALATFGHQLAAQGLHLTRGGRFWHVMDATDKGQAMQRLCALYRQAGFERFTTIALGDSPNDAELLAAADIAVIVRRKDGEVLDCRGRRQTLRTETPGPGGWNTAMHQILDQLETTTKPTSNPTTPVTPQAPTG